MSTKFPGSIDDQYSLLTASDNASTNLSASIATDSTTIYVVDTSEFPDKGVATIHNRSFSVYEKFYYDSKTNNSFSVLSRPVPLAHSVCDEVYVSALVTEDYHNYLRDALIAVESYVLTGDSTSVVTINVDSSTGITNFIDKSRGNKHLSTSRDSIDFSRNRQNLNSQYLRYNGMVGSVGRGFIRNATITGISVNCENNVDAWFRIRKNNIGTDIHSIQLSSVKSRQRDAITIDINKGDYLQVYMDVVSGNVNYPVVYIEYAWRF